MWLRAVADIKAAMKVSSPVRAYWVDSRCCQVSLPCLDGWRSGPDRERPLAAGQATGSSRPVAAGQSVVTKVGNAASSGLSPC